MVAWRLRSRAIDAETNNLCSTNALESESILSIDDIALCMAHSPLCEDAWSCFAAADAIRDRSTGSCSDRSSSCGITMTPFGSHSPRFSAYMIPDANGLKESPDWWFMKCDVIQTALHIETIRDAQRSIVRPSVATPLIFTARARLSASFLFCLTNVFDEIQMS